MKKQHLPLLWGASRRLDGQKKKNCCLKKSTDYK